MALQRKKVPSLVFRTRESLFSSKFWLFGLFLLSQFYFTIQAQVYPIELCIAVIYLLNFNRYHPSGYLPNWLIPTLVLWVSVSVLSDWNSGSEQIDSIKGLLRVLLLTIDIIVICAICKTRRDTLVAWSGIMLSWALSVVTQPNIYTTGDYWKWGFAIPVTLAVFLALAYKPQPKPVVQAALIGLAALHFALGFRSMAVVVLVTSAILLIQKDPSNTRPTTKSQANRLLVWVFIGVGAIGALATYLYDVLALQGVFGERAALKASFQGTGSLGSLLSGRSEVLMSLQSISESPILGHGSFSTPTATSYLSAATFFSDNGYASVSEAFLNQRFASYHSEILGTIAENGIFAGAFWFGLAFFLLRSLRDSILTNDKALALVIFLSTLGVWDVFFSPFGADRRVWIALTIATVIRFVGKRSKESAVDNHRNYKL